MVNETVVFKHVKELFVGEIYEDDLLAEVRNFIRSNIEEFQFMEEFLVATKFIYKYAKDEEAGMVEYNNYREEITNIR